VAYWERRLERLSKFAGWCSWQTGIGFD